MADGDIKFFRYDKDKTRIGRDFVRFPWAEEFFIRALLKKTGLPAQARFLDLGCGTGKYSCLLKQYNMDVLGLDLSQRGIRIARDRYPGIKFIVGDVLNLPMPPASFDAVLCSGLSLFNEPALAVLRPFVDNVLTCLKSRGWFVFVKTTALTDRLSRNASRMDYALATYKEFFDSFQMLEVISAAAVYPHLFIPFGQRAFENPMLTSLSSTMARVSRIPVRVYFLMRKGTP